MNLINHLFSYFYLLHLSLTFIFLTVFFQKGQFIFLIVSLSLLYLFPPLVHRALMGFTPLKEGKSNILEKVYIPWWASHQIQMLFSMTPILENLLMPIPGLYSSWLRLWGSHIGKNVYWTPGTRIFDRSLIVVGNNVVFGVQCQIFSHVINKNEESLWLNVNKVTIGSNSFIGAASNIGPGVVIEEGSRVPVMTAIFPNRTWKKNQNETTLKV
jgi:acetyltransferase-like isoleucine patch superfamily enzyme